MNVSFVIPNFNGESILPKNLPKILAVAKKNNVQVVIIDDFSHDTSVSYLENEIRRRKDENIVLIKNDKNLGFASSVNRGVKIATGDIVVLLNTDVVPHENFLQPLIRHFYKENVFAVGCMDESIEKDHVVLRGRGLGKWQRGFFVHRRGEVNHSSTMWVSGGSGAFRRSLWEKFGGFNTLYNPYYWEDIDLSYRAQKAGYVVLFEKESKVIHEHEKGSIKGSYSLFDIKITAYRNQCFFVWLNASDKSIIVSHILWLPYHLIKTLLKGDFAFLFGFFKAILLMPEVFVARKNIQKMRVRTDKEVVYQNN